MDGASSQFQKIQILLHEYDTLRNEVLSRYAAQFQSTGVLAIIIIGLTTVLITQGAKITILVLIGITVMLYIGAQIWIDYDIAKAARRLREIEADVNSRAGETLLQWETVWGLGGKIRAAILKVPR